MSSKTEIIVSYSSREKKLTFGVKRKKLGFSWKKKKKRKTKRRRSNNKQSKFGHFSFEREVNKNAGGTLFA